MFEQLQNLTLKEWCYRILDVILYIFSKWYLLLLAAVFAAGIGYLFRSRSVTSYSASFSFVLSTETKSSGLTGLASQFGLEVGTGGSENIFAGDNIVELFKSRKMVSYALMHQIEEKHMTLLTLMTQKMYPAQAKQILPFPDEIKNFSPAQKSIYEKLVANITGSFTVFKKDKRLIFYTINATSFDKDIAYYVAKYMLDETSLFFIDTKTKVATRSLELLHKEADSLGLLLGYMYRATAELNDRSFNINPSILTQRSNAQLNTAKSAAVAAAYSEVMRNLEIAKINIQKETPLFQVIDEPVLPLREQTTAAGSILVPMFLGLVLMVAALALERLLKYC
jgi:hypothetical protein